MWILVGKTVLELPTLLVGEVLVLLELAVGLLVLCEGRLAGLGARVTLTDPPHPSPSCSPGSHPGFPLGPLERREVGSVSVVLSPLTVR